MNIPLKGLFVFNDPLCLFFLAVIGMVSLPSLIYSFGYLKGHYSTRRIRLCQGLSLLFICSMAAVVCAGNVLAFLISWESMSLISFFLVAFDHEQAQSVRAGLVYIVMTHAGTAFLVAGFLVMYSFTGSWDYAAIQAACHTMPPAVKNAVFVLLFLGFSTKVGIVPLHIWLPVAHPQAPSHISSIMSGVMIKTAIYGMIRFIIQIVGVSSAWWGIVVLIAAGVSCLVGVIYALMEHDLKKLLAFHSVENVGIIMLGVGACMLFLQLDLTLLAAVSLAAGLYHLVNHAAFKGLLFLGAGSVYKATGTRDMEKLGGLIKRMPRTAIYFLIGSMAIAGLPPLNGFVSEWLTLQVFFQGAWGVQAGAMKLFLGVCAAVLAFTGGLAAACFVKAFGISFLALPRSKQAEKAVEAPGSMQAGMFLLSGAIVALGLMAVQVFRLLLAVAGQVLALDVSSIRGLNPFMLVPAVQGQAAVSTPLLALLLAGMGVCAYVILKPRGVVAGKTWGCGYYKLDSRNEYTATAQSKPFRIAFGFFLLPYRRTQKIRESFYHFTSFVYETHTTPVFRKYLYRPLVSGVFRTASSMKRLQAGSIHLYIGYIFVTLIALLIFLKNF
jgi:hydrogenase-4 component B